jgi:hypothetical protein
VIGLAVLCAGCEGDAERLVRGYLVDPDSAEFSEVVTSNGVTCGLVNSKNRMGGFTGRQIFIVRDGRVLFMRDDAYAAALGDAPCSPEALSVSVRQIYNEARSTNDRAVAR